MHTHGDMLISERRGKGVRRGWSLISLVIDTLFPFDLHRSPRILQQALRRKITSCRRRTGLLISHLINENSDCSHSSCYFLRSLEALAQSKMENMFRERKRTWQRSTERVLLSSAWPITLHIITALLYGCVCFLFSVCLSTFASWIGIVVTLLLLKKIVILYGEIYANEGLFIAPQRKTRDKIVHRANIYRRSRQIGEQLSSNWMMFVFSRRSISIVDVCEYSPSSILRVAFFSGHSRIDVLMSPLRE